MISDNREGLAQILIDEAGDALEWGKYIRFDYPVMNCYGIDECFNLLFTGNKDGVSISDYKNGYVLNAIIDLVRNGQYRIIESWRISQDARMFDATSIQEIYTGDELMNRDEDRVLYNLFFKLFRKPDIFYLIIKYCWFNFVDGLIHAPIMIYEDKVMIYINGGIKDCEAIENWFDTDKGVKEFFESMRYYKYEWDKPDTYKPTTILFTFNEAGKEKLSAVKGWFKFPIKLMDANICL